MSKTTKIIAALGVVAGLGVAALPAFTYAAETVTGDVEVDVEILPAIAMTITGNNDNGSVVPFGEPRVSYTAVTPTGDENPSEEGWYVENGGEYTVTTDTEVDEDTTYYVRNTRTSYNQVDAFSPAGAASSTIDIHPTPATSINALSSSAWKMLPNAVVNGNDTNNFKSTINVYTNATGGYNLSIKDADAVLALTRDGSGEQPTIPAGIESEGSFALTAGVGAWGYVVDTASEGTGYKAITASDVQIKQQSAPTSAEVNRKTTVYYGVATAADQATGTYRDTIVYTATTR